MNLQETHTLRRLDEKVGPENSGIIETQFGDVIVAKTNRTHFVAHFDVVNSIKFYGPTPSTAFLNLLNRFQKDAEEGELLHWNLNAAAKSLGDSDSEVPATAQAVQHFDSIN